MKRIVVCDTGPLLHLSEAGAIHLLQHAGQILIPESVTKEFNQNAQGWNPPQWIEVHELDKTAQKRSNKFIESNTVDWGEAEAIALAIQVEADWFATDDAKARQLAESFGLESHGSIGILLWSLAVDNINGEQARRPKQETGDKEHLKPQSHISAQPAPETDQIPKAGSTLPARQ